MKAGYYRCSKCGTDIDADEGVSCYEIEVIELRKKNDIQREQLLSALDREKVLEDYVENALSILQGKITLKDNSFHSWEETVFDVNSLLDVGLSRVKSMREGK